MLIGLIALLVSIMAAQQIYEIYSDSCVFLESNQKSVGVSTSGGGLFSHPYYNRCFEGQIIVEGKNVEFRVINREPTVITRVVNGIKVNSTVFSRDSPTHDVLSITVDGTYRFNLPANGDYYECALQNTGSQQAKVTFQLNEIQTDIGKLIPGAIALLVTALPGTALIISGRKGKKQLASTPLK
ncbi:MAG: hypothetical protein QM398_12475 [Thermoproteota archaeon]|nr:hypothetical protein [Thermoproteota archaeon]